MSDNILFYDRLQELEKGYLDVDDIEHDEEVLMDTYDDYELFLSRRSDEDGSLCRNDYNLNSPLIKDLIEDLLARIITRQGEERFEGNRQLKYAASILRGEGMVTSRMKAAEGFFDWVIDEVYQCRKRESDFRKILEKCFEFNDGSAEVLQIFVETLVGNRRGEMAAKLVKKPTLWTPQASQVWNYLEQYWIFHQLILGMNAQSKDERLSLVNNPNVLWATSEETDIRGFFTMRGKCALGEVICTDGFVAFLHHNRIADRNMILMIKDTCIARAATLIAMMDQEGDDRTSDEWIRMSHLYNAGDSVCREMGDGGFPLIKLLEPSVTQRLHELASANRPMIPKFDDFKNYLIESRNKLRSETKIHIDPFFDVINREDSVHVLLNFFGAFRHWGHPFIKYLEGLKKLHHQVTLIKDIDEQYANKLASDLAYKIVIREVRTKHRWPVAHHLLGKDHPLKNFVKRGQLPTGAVTQEVGDNWHRLPLTTCFEIPETIDPTVLYSDKSHSMDKPDVVRYIEEGNKGQIPTKRVLETALITPREKLSDKLMEYNVNGLPDSSKIIGLKGKEREIKDMGRFFALMSWKMREYFVITEHLIKDLFLPLFQGLTMADDLISVTRKMIHSSSGQGGSSYDQIGITNHLDYEKWNNHQRKEANNPIFRVMGQFLGYPNLFTRTHEFFEGSLIYYADRADLMRVEDGKVISDGDQVSWQGQAGGLEGLRQKGWSIVNYLVIERESKSKNTKVDTIAQGDNQVIRCLYKSDYKPHLKDTESRLRDMVTNNHAIMKAIEMGTRKLGLLINKEETLISADLMLYSKVVIFRGNLCGSESKRYSRVTCITNDQFPTVSNVLSSISTCCLTVAQQSNSIVQSMISYVFFGHLALVVSRLHNPLLKKRLKMSDDFKPDDWDRMTIRALFLDPSLGGSSGTSLTRFLIRQYPDPVTESLAFWKRILEETDNENIKAVGEEAWSPLILNFKSEHMSKLLENPLSLNTYKSANPMTIVKEQVKVGLQDNLEDVQNPLFYEAISNMGRSEEELNEFLENIEPLFPRFLSEFRNSTFFGIVDGIVNLFSNAKTMRNRFARRVQHDVNVALIRAEEQAILISENSRILKIKEKTCSAARADELREESWGNRVYGATVPHPYEIFGRAIEDGGSCNICRIGETDRVSVIYENSFSTSMSTRGDKVVYMGSKTSEATTLFHHWEKQVNIPLIKRAGKMRDAIGWFIKEGSNIAKSIYNNLNKLTNVSWDENPTGFKRTGTALHRFHCSRQSHGGFISTSPALASYVFVTSDTMSEVNKENHDFMYQSCLLYAQGVGLEIKQRNPQKTRCHHFHIGCKLCMRKIEPINLTSKTVYTPHDTSEILARMSGVDIEWGIPRFKYQIEVGDWEALGSREKSFYIGSIQGSVYGILVHQGSVKAEESSLFPIGMTKSLIPSYYLMGLIRGLENGASNGCILTRSVYERNGTMRVFRGEMIHLIETITSSKTFLSFINGGKFKRTLESISHRVTPSYPSSDKDLGQLVRTFLLRMFETDKITRSPFDALGRGGWIFSDFKTNKWIGLLTLTHALRNNIRFSGGSRHGREEFNMIKSGIEYFLNLDRESNSGGDESLDILGELGLQMSWCNSEVRHAVKEIHVMETDQLEDYDDESLWGQEWVGEVVSQLIDFRPVPDESLLGDHVRVSDTMPLISGLRTAMLATGAHPKIMSIIRGEHIDFEDFLCIGDGCGGMTSTLLRWNRESRAIFNSLLDLANKELRGSKPNPPSAIEMLPPSMKARCVNKDTCWEQHDDLTDLETWNGFVSIKKEYDLEIDLIVCDAEPKDLEDMKKIVKNLGKFFCRLFSRSGSIIIKSYVNHLLPGGSGILEVLGPWFKEIRLAVTSLTSSHSTEMYVVCMGFLRRNSGLCHVDKTSLEQGLRIAKSTRSIVEEFQRAQRLAKEDMLIGVPSNLIPNHRDEMMWFLTSVRVRRGVSYQLSYSRKEHLSKGLEMIIYLISMVSNDLIPITSIYKTGPGVPSDQEIRRLLSFLCACWMYASVRTGNIDRYNAILRFHNDGCAFDCHIIPTTINRHSGWVRMWKLNRLGHSGPRGKNFSKPFDPRIVGQGIRALHRNYQHLVFSKPSLKTIAAVNREIKEVNRGLNVERVDRSTGGFEGLWEQNRRWGCMNDQEYTSREHPTDNAVNQWLSDYQMDGTYTG